MFACSKCQNYDTDWLQMLRNYEEQPGKCPLRIETARLSVLGEISWHFWCFFAADCHFYVFPYHFRLLPRRLTQSAFAKTASTTRHITTELQADMHRQIYVHAGMPRKFNHYMHACLARNYPEALSYCGHGHYLTSVAQLSVIHIADIRSAFDKTLASERFWQNAANGVS